MSQYFREGVPHEPKVTRMIEHAYSFDFIVTTSEFEALVLECSQIKLHSPKYNILLKDDKGYCFIRVGKGPYPRITAELQKQDDGAQWIGPYMSSFAVREMVATAQDVFRLHRCNKQFPRDFGKERPCLNYHIGKCMAPCTGKISEAEYAECVDGAVRLIRSGKNEIVRRSCASGWRRPARRWSLKRPLPCGIRSTRSKRSPPASGWCRAPSNRRMSSALSPPTGRSARRCSPSARGGWWTRTSSPFPDTTDADEVREEFLPRFYSGVREMPRLILVDKLPESAPDLEQMLSEQAGRKVTLSVPQRGDGPRLVQMAALNASESLTLRSGRVSREERLLDEVAKTLGLEQPPTVIESYDISNWGEGTSVAGMVVFENGRPKKSGYRRFKIKSVTGTDDYASMAEVLWRRAYEYANEGKGQFGGQAGPDPARRRQGAAVRGHRGAGGHRL